MSLLGSWRGAEPGEASACGEPLPGRTAAGGRLRAAHTWAGSREEVPGEGAQQAITELLTGLLHTCWLADRSLWHRSHRQQDKAAPQLRLYVSRRLQLSPARDSAGLLQNPSRCKLPAGEVPWLPHVRVQQRAAMLREQNLGPSDEVKMYLAEHEGGYNALHTVPASQDTPGQPVPERGQRWCSELHTSALQGCCSSWGEQRLWVYIYSKQQMFL